MVRQVSRERQWSIHFQCNLCRETWNLHLKCGNDNDSLTHNEVCFSFDEDEFYIIHTRVLLHVTSWQNKHKEPENEPFPCFIANLGINAISIKFLTGPLFTCRSFLPHTVASVLLKAANSPQGFWKGQLAHNLQGLSF